MITLKELKIVNYRNINFQILHFDGNSKIVGDNRIGKTNTLEALYWLLTDKLLNGSKDIEQIKPLSDTKSKVEVSAIFQIDEKNISIGKEYAEEWVKTRGTEELVFKGHSTTYIYNGVKQGTKKQFDLLFAADFNIGGKEYQGIDIIQMLINPLYLGRMGDTDDWKNLRSMIIDIVGDVDDRNVFDANPKLEPIWNDMSRAMGRTDQIIKQYRDNIKTFKEDIIGCDANIKMLENTPCPTDESVAAAKKEIEEIQDKIRSLKVDSSDEQTILLIDQEIVKIRNEIIELKREDLEKKNQKGANSEKTALEEEKKNLYEEANGLINRRSELLKNHVAEKFTLEKLSSSIDERSKNRLNLIDEIKAIDEQLKNPLFEKECPYCHRPYDVDKIEEHLANATKELHIKRTDIVARGKENTDALKQDVEKYELQKKVVDDLSVEIKRIEDSVKIITTKVTDINEKLAAFENNDVGIEEENPKITALTKQISDKEGEKARIRSSQIDKENSIRSLLADAQTKKEQCQKVIDDYNFYLGMQEKINEVKEKRSTIMANLIQTEQKVELVKDFIKAKLEMLNDNIKKVFDDVSFMLIEPQVNGGYSTVCKPYIKGTNTLWKSGSKSEQITTGIAICEKIKVALSLPDFPYLFDEGGEISTNTFETHFVTKSQLICVQVKDGILIPTVMDI